jgi:hypothetical protein
MYCDASVLIGFEEQFIGLASPKRYELLRLVVWMGYSRQLLVSTTILVSDEIMRPRSVSLSRGTGV